MVCPSFPLPRRLSRRFVPWPSFFFFFFFSLQDEAWNTSSLRSCVNSCTHIIGRRCGFISAYTSGSLKAPLIKYLTQYLTW
ncbi:uncharacterized protein GGS25DRAFT_508466 [Hypoxylon fragiforme]|uniref:uncharacterized protein n=1 Tax=Hypoxylon fragiforme TaxID=63214 RepID=UPI0020C6B578|nr:uncharacterized protein GGS25DRAFT_508466 [Hypoxylon fragiforme]KAI2604492.1 hypothetical protein GGS25DRAFT_508466 [Hypoxylon fragiforme]